MFSLDYCSCLIFHDYGGSIIVGKSLEVAGTMGDLGIADWLGSPHIVGNIEDYICRFNAQRRFILRRKRSPSVGWAGGTR